MNDRQHGATHRAPLVSIGLPVRNGASLIGDAIESLLSQTYREIELIISDNDSTDGTADVCRAFADRDRRVRYVRQPRNIGLIENFAFVLREATGSYFMWAAYDDLWEPSYVEVLTRGLETDSGYVGAFSPWVGIDGRGDVVKTGPRLALQSTNPLARIRNLTFGREDTCTYALWRSDVVKRLRIKPWPVLADCSDEQSHTWLYFLASAGPVKECAETTFYYRCHPNRRWRLGAIAWVKINQIVRTPMAVFRGSRSLPLTVVGTSLNVFYQARNFTWLVAKRALGLEGRSRAELALGAQRRFRRAKATLLGKRA